jgi:hypothetical protein
VWYALDMKKPTKEQWAIWKQEIRKWMEDHRSAYVRGRIDILIEDAITAVGNPYNLDPIEIFIEDAIAAVGNPYNLDPDELWDMAINVLDPEY